MLDTSKKLKIAISIIGLLSAAIVVQAAVSNLAYTNPQSQISVFATKFSTDIPQGPAEAPVCKQWASYTFNLPVNSYVNIGTSGTVIADIGANVYTNWILVADDGGNCNFNNGAGQVGTYVDNYGFNSGMYMQMHAQDTFYLTKGQHTVYLYGQAQPINGQYTVNGEMSILAFPEYTKH